MNIIDKSVREDIIQTKGSIVVSASAGSGKTTIMVRKILKVLSEIKDHKTLAAITFTVKATQEIKRKVNNKGENKEFVVMTNDSFVEHEIIRPFLMDAFGKKYKNDFLISYENSCKSNSFELSMEILEKQNKLGTYNAPFNNFKFQLAKKVLERSEAAREYFKSKYLMLFLDEYQDSDIDMHELFMYIKNKLNIELFIVGDEKQAIYLWRGAQKNIFKLFENEKMHKYELIHNFRSHEEIVNYAHFLHDYPNFNHNYTTSVNRIVHCKTKDFIDSFVKLVDSGELDLSRSITIIANRNNHAQQIANNLNESKYSFTFIPKTPIDESTENSVVLRAIACFVLDENYSAYDMAENLGLEQIPSVINRIEIFLNPLKNLVPLELNKTKKDVRKNFFDIVNKFSLKFNVDIKDTEIELLLKTLSNKSLHISFIQSSELYKVMTVFGSKGLEFSQVISFSRYYNLENEGEKNNHYVFVTRAEKKVIIIDDHNYNEIITKKANEKGILNTNSLFKSINHINC
ncbi:UvrD-helicase domain-containing protein [Brochothrix thermosphacta]|nr:UvrD-helicase domain-containing protein [Brochothrix thermosphacta]